MFASAFAAWLPGATPARAMMLATLRLSSGISTGFALYAIEVNKPRKRSSPHTLPLASKRLTAM